MSSKQQRHDVDSRIGANTIDRDAGYYDAAVSSIIHIKSNPGHADLRRPRPRLLSVILKKTKPREKDEHHNIMNVCVALVCDVRDLVFIETKGINTTS